MLSPHLRRHGREALAYATLQEGMEYYVEDKGYIAFATVRHPVFARQPRRIVLSDPVCAPAELPGLVRRFLAENPRAAFAVVSEECATTLRGLGFKINCLGYEPEIPIQTYNTRGNWKELDLIKRARNEAKREGLAIREVDIRTLDPAELNALSSRWIAHKPIHDREIWMLARRPVFDLEEDVRKYVAFDRAGKVVGFAFYDPMYRDERVYGYAANIVRTDEQRFGRLATALHMEASDQFRSEGKEILNLLLAPFMKLSAGKYNDDWSAKLFFELSVRFGGAIYNFEGLSFHKAKYRAREKCLYLASNNLLPLNDVYLGFLHSDITTSYFSTLGRLLWGMLTGWRRRPLTHS